MNDNLLLTVIDRFNASNIAEFDYTDGKIHLLLRKQSGTPAEVPPKVPCTKEAEPIIDKKPPPLQPRPPKALPRAEKPTEGVTLNQAEVDAILNRGSSAPAPKIEPINSPIVATFYARPSPDAPPFVTPGSKVKAGATLCVLEAMKKMNNLEAEFDCEIVSVKVATGDLVEFGQTLFEVKRST